MRTRRLAGWIVLVIMGSIEALLVSTFGSIVFQHVALGVAWWRTALALAQFVLYAALPGALILVGLRLVRASDQSQAAARAPLRPHPVPVSALDEAAIDQVELLAQVEGPVSACPECGFLGVRAPGVRDGLWPGGGEVGARFVCPRCQYQGMPVEFDSGDDYAAWVRELHRDDTVD